MNATTTTTAVRPVTAADHSAIGRVLAAAFADDPVFTWMTPDAAARNAALPTFFTWFAQAYEPLGASRVIEDVAGAALWAPPGTQAIPDEEAEAFLGRIAGLPGVDADRLVAVVTLLDEQHPHTPCHYLNLLGVEPARRGQGLGSALLAETLRACDAAGEPAYLEATSPDNRRLYLRHGFAVVGEIVLPGGPSLWPMWRDPRT